MKRVFLKWLWLEREIGYRIGSFIFISLLIGFIAVMFWKAGYHTGNSDGLKKAYRYDMFRKYPEYFEDWNIYGAEINENGQGKRGMK
jgi:hypothetical protein